MNNTTPCPKCGAPLLIDLAVMSTQPSRPLGAEAFRGGHVEFRSDAPATLERRMAATAAELRVSRGGDGKPTKIEGYGAVFNSLSETLSGVDENGKKFKFREKIKPGAFAKAIAAGDVRGLFNHDPNLILGRTSSKTMRLAEDDKGLRFEMDLNAGDSLAADVAARVERKDVSGCSFGFRPVKDSWEIVGGEHIRTILEVGELLDVGPVTYPAYTATEVDVRALLTQPSVLTPQSTESRAHPDDAHYSAVASGCREMGYRCRSMAESMRSMRDVIDKMEVGSTDGEELKHLRDLHRSLRDLAHHTTELRERTKKHVAAARPADDEDDEDDEDTDAGKAGGEGEGEGGDGEVRRLMQAIQDAAAADLPTAELRAQLAASGGGGITAK